MDWQMEDLQAHTFCQIRCNSGTRLCQGFRDAILKPKALCELVHFFVCVVWDEVLTHADVSFRFPVRCVGEVLNIAV